MIATGTRPRVLCVDDEPDVLSGLSLHLRRRYDIETASSGAAALQLLEKSSPGIACIISDMRMPGMNGAEFLSQAHRRYPDITRILLTGQSDLNAAIQAVNEGQIFRFLTKPCPPPALLSAVDAAAELNRLMTAERVLLEQTLHGCVRTLIDVLALTNPASFGRANRIKTRVTQLAEKLEVGGRWQVEVAAMLSQLGTIILPLETAEKLHYGSALTPDEEKMVARIPAATEQLLGHIPRLEGVRQLLADCNFPRKKADSSQGIPIGQVNPAEILRVASDFDSLESMGHSETDALATLRTRANRYDPVVVDALETLIGKGEARTIIRDVPLSALRVGMSFAQDVKMTTGTMLVARGFEITPSFLQRVKNFRPGTVLEPLRVVIAPGIDDPMTK